MRVYVCVYGFCLIQIKIDGLIDIFSVRSTNMKCGLRIAERNNCDQNNVRKSSISAELYFQQILPEKRSGSQCCVDNNHTPPFC